jgi:hypothetical protein
MAKTLAMIYYPATLEDDCEGVGSVSVHAISDSVEKLTALAEATMNHERDIDVDDLLVMRTNTEGTATYVQFKADYEEDEDQNWLTYFYIDEVEIL